VRSIGGASCIRRLFRTRFLVDVAVSGKLANVLSLIDVNGGEKGGVMGEDERARRRRPGKQ